MTDITKKLMSKMSELKVGSGDFETLNNKNYFDPGRLYIHTGSSNLDCNIGSFGFPVGLTEISGMSKSGKTTLALMGMLNFQQRFPDGICVILSSEYRDNDQYAKQIGLDTERIHLIKSKNVEDLFYNFQIFINALEVLWREEQMEGKPKIYVFWDSIGGTNSRAELNTFMENVKIHQKNLSEGTKTEAKHAKIADFAKMAKHCMKAILAQIYDKDIVFIAINHLIDNVDGTGGQSSGGGHWITFLPVLRLLCKRKEWITMEMEDMINGKAMKKIEQVGQITTVYIEKNDFGSRKSTDVEIFLGYGIVLSANDIAYAINKGILKAPSALKRSFMNDKLKWSSRREFYDLYKTHNKLLPILHKKIMQERHKEVLESKQI